MGKSSTVLRAEITAVQPNDSSGVTQGFLRSALHTVQKCNSAKSLDAMQSILDALLADIIAVEGSAAPKSATTIRNGVSNDVTGVTQEFNRIAFHAYENVNHDILSPGAKVVEAACIVLTTEIAAKKAAL